MRKTLLATTLATTLAAGLALPGLAQAQGTQPAIDTSTPTQSTISVVDSNAPAGKAANTFMVRLRAIGVLPHPTASSVSIIGGDINATSQAAPELDVSYFFTDNIALELIAASTRHNVSVTNSALGKVDVGSIWILPPTVTLQYHFFPKERFSPYIGAGVNMSFFYASKPNEPTIRSWSLGSTFGPAIQVGFDYNIAGNWFLNMDVKQIFMRVQGPVHTNIGGPRGTTVQARTWLNPTVVGVGVGYRF